MQAAARPFNSWDALKILALALMLVDHVGHFFYPDELWIRAIGRAAAPVFLFLAGFAASYRTRWNLIALTVPLDLFNMVVAGHFQPFSILFTIFCGRLILESREAPEHRIKKPFEWYIICVFWIISLSVIQYGSMALLIMLCGYLKRFSSDYTRRTRQIFWALSFITYSAVQVYIAEFNVMETLLMIACMLPTALLLWRFDVRPIALPAPLAAAGTWIARNMAYLYAAHLALLVWITKVPF